MLETGPIRPGFFLFGPTPVPLKPLLILADKEEGRTRVKRVLFVDDEPRVLDGTRRMMHPERQRWEMHFAEGAEAGLLALDASSFDVVVTDMRMPGMDGAAFLAQVRDRWPSTARIILSGTTEADVAVRAIPVAHRFLAKPCEASALREAIERVCTLQDVLNSAELRHLVSSIGELPSLSRTYTALTSAMTDPEVAVKRVADIIEADMAMSAKVLQLANNAFFGATQTMTTILGAVAYLGIETIKNLVLSADAFRAFPPQGAIPARVWDELQQHAQRTALIAGKLPLARGGRDLVVPAALLHEVGQLVLATKMPEKFSAVLDLAAKRKCSTFLVEEELLGTTHAEVGSYLLGLWGLPHLIVEAIAHHHHPTRIPHSGLDVAAALYVADLIADLPVPTNDKPDPPSQTDSANLSALGVYDQFAEWRQFGRA